MFAATVARLSHGLSFGNRAVAIDAQHAAGEIAADVGIVGEVVVDAVEIGVVEAEPIGAGDEQRAVAREHDPPLGAFGDHLDVLQAPLVLRQPRPRDGLHPDLHRPPLGERLGPDALVEELDRPDRRRFAFRRREVGEVERPVAREVGIEQQVVQALRGDGLHAGGTPASGADTTPSGRTIRIVPLASVMRKLPLGRNAMLHGPLSRLVTVSTVNAADGFDGAGAFVCPAKRRLRPARLAVDA